MHNPEQKSHEASPSFDVLKEAQKKKTPDQFRAEYLARLPELVCLAPPTWQEIEKKYGGPDKAEHAFTTVVRGLFERLQDTMNYSISIDETDVTDVMRDMYAVFLACQQSPSATPAWMSAYANHDAFFSQVVPKATLNAKGAWSKFLLMFLYDVASIRRTIEVSDRRIDKDKRTMEYFGIEGEWSIIESTNPMNWEFPGLHAFIEKRVAAEAQRLVHEGYRACDLSHMTSTAALDGIAKAGGLVASKHLRDRGVQPVTGEFVSGGSEDYGHKGLSEVYAANGDPTWGYQTLRWFDERPVGFGINREKQRRTIKEQMIPDLGKQVRDAEFDWGSEGVLVGYEVPLANIDRVYCLQNDMDNMRPWVAAHCPHAELVCLDAVDIIHRHGYRMEQAALSNETTPQEEWEKLFARLRPKPVRASTKESV